MTDRAGPGTAVRAYPLMGAGVIAMAYGFARFALGQFIPAMREDLGLDGATIGVIGALPFVGFCVASLVAARIVERLGPRRSLTLILALGAAGLATMAGARNGWALGAGALVCGLCTGTSMPALAAGARRRIPSRRRAHGEAVMNAGTSAGVALVAPVAVLAAGTWRSAYVAFAVAALVLVPFARRLAPDDDGPSTSAATPPPTTVSQRSAIRRLIGFSLLMGFAAAPFWLFAPERTAGGDTRTVALLWAALGIGGLIAGAVGDAASRFGDRVTQATAALFLAAGTAVAATTTDPIVLLPGAAAFGLGYMALTGLYLVTGTRMLPNRPALGPVVPFVAVAAGQAVGSGAAGFGVDRAGHGPVLVAGTIAALLLATASPRFPATLRPGAGR